MGGLGWPMYRRNGSIENTRLRDRAYEREEGRGHMLQASRSNLTRAWALNAFQTPDERLLKLYVRHTTSSPRNCRQVGDFISGFAHCTTVFCLLHRRWRRSVLIHMLLLRMDIDCLEHERHGAETQLSTDIPT
jgi:hypothetical protein